VSLIPGLTNQTFRPLYFIDSQEDQMPHHQIGDVLAALQNANIDSSLYFHWTIPNSMVHEFNYWDDRIKLIPGDNSTVGQNVIAWLDAHLKGP
jgi:hypothetical protein